MVGKRELIALNLRNRFFVLDLYWGTGQGLQEICNVVSKISLQKWGSEPRRVS